MALKTNINPAENIVYNEEFSNILETDQILLLNKPLMIYNTENMESTLVLGPANNANHPNLNLPELVFDADYFQHENLQSVNSQNDYGLHENFRFINERQQVDEGLAVLELLCNNRSDLEQPEFIDINDLPNVNYFDESKTVDIPCVSDDDDVVFVRQYMKDEHTKKIEKEIGSNSDKSLSNDNSPKVDRTVRRNPVRNARIKSKKLSKEHILEEDFSLLDSSDEEKKEIDKENKNPNKKSPPQSEIYKQWPVNAHERPQYNTETKKIEALDYTMREVQKKTPTKKPRLETVPVRRKSKKKYFTRKRKPRVDVPKKVCITDLKMLVSSTTGLLKDLLKNVKESKRLINPENRCLEKWSNGISEILKNQTILFSVVNGLNHDEVLKRFNENDFNESETKD